MNKILNIKEQKYDRNIINRRIDTYKSYMEEKMNIYEKINEIKETILKNSLKKSGKNKFANYEYFELADFVPTIIKKCKEIKLTTIFNFNEELAILTIINAEKIDEKETYTSPMKNLEIKGCNAIQALGGVETYQRRYLYMIAFDITENDMFDGEQDKTITESQIKIIKNVYKEKIVDLLKVNNIEKIENLSMQKASEIISKLRKIEKESK